MTEEKKTTTRKKAVKQEIPVPKEVIKPGSISIYTLAGQRMRFENIKRYDIAVTDSVPLCVIQDFTGRVRTVILERGWIVDFQPEGK